MASQQTILGKVTSLWRYPVKSMLGEELNSAEIAERGVVGDRAFALVDSTTGKVVSAKHPKKWARLFEFSASYVEAPRAGQKLPPVRVTLPDGAVITSESEGLNEVFSRIVGRDVRWSAPALPKPSLEEYWPNIEGLAHRETVTDEAMPPNTFFDLAAIHILTTSTIARLRELYPQGRIDVRRFRPNIFIEVASGEKNFVEDGWIGHTLLIGNQVRLGITGPCPRCVMTTLPQGDLPQDSRILATAARHNQANVGVYAGVLQGGLIRTGDPVRLES